MKSVRLSNAPSRNRKSWIRSVPLRLTRKLYALLQVNRVETNEHELLVILERNADIIYELIFRFSKVAVRNFKIRNKSESRRITHSARSESSRYRAS